jgi:N-sulfoglucosamine sulfohydrolase
MRNLTLILLVLSLASCRSKGEQNAEKKESSIENRPNIILITADDLGNQVGCYGDKYARTPSLDQMASEGFRFTTAWVTQSSCSSSRSSLFTGLYPHQNGQVGLAHLGVYCKETPRLPNLLKEAGYRTGILGKLHVQPEVNFDFDLEVKQNWTRDVRRVAREAMAFIESDDEKPFFLKISYFDPHGRYIDQVEGIPEEIFKEGDIKTPGWVRGNRERTDSRIASFYNCITRVDVGMSLLMDTLKRSGRIENTMIIFFGDNGAPFPGGKTTCYEAGMEVPLIIYWEGGDIKSGQVCDELVSAIDIMPTILEACGVKAPEDLEGQSLLPILRGEKVTDWRRYMFGEMTFHEPRQYKPSRTVRDDRYHLIQNLYTTDMPEWELFDLVTDPDELENLAEDPAYSRQLNKLKRELDKWRENTHDPLLDPDVDKKWRELSEQVQETNRFDPPVYLVK